MTPGNRAAVLNRIDANHYRRARFFRQLYGYLPDGTKPYHDHEIADAHIAVAHAAHGELRRVIADGVFPATALRHFAKLIVIHGVNDDGFHQRAIGADQVAHGVFGDACAALDNLAHHHIAELEFAELNATRCAFRARREELPFAGKFFIDKRTGRAKIHHFGAVFRRAEAHADFHFIIRDCTVLIFHQRRHARCLSH